VKRAFLVAVALLVGPASLEAQSSIYGILGVGFPSRAISARSRAMGGGLDAIDPWSAVNPGAVAFHGALGASFESQTTLRSYTAGDVDVSNRRGTRFPLAMLAGPLPHTPITFAVSAGAYADRTYRIETADTLVVRGDSVAVLDRLGSDGAINDLRGAMAWNVSPALKVGAAVHVFSGATRESVTRSFDDSSYAGVSQRSEVGYHGWGASIGTVVTPTPWLRLGASARRDSRLGVSRNLLPSAAAQLPWTLSGGILISPALGVAWSTSVMRRTWSDTGLDGGGATGVTAFDTWEIGTGIDVGGIDLWLATVPLRLGWRYAQLPFSSTGERAREISYSGGTGFQFSEGRGLIELALERAVRDGAGASERAWQFTFQLLVRP
jgi:hypothetical protein